MQAKVGLYRTLFAGRSDVYAYRWENTAEGPKAGRRNGGPGTTRDNPEYLPLTDEIIAAQLTLVGGHYATEYAGVDAVVLIASRSVTPARVLHPG